MKKKYLTLLMAATVALLSQMPAHADSTKLVVKDVNGISRTYELDGTEILSFVNNTLLIQMDGVSDAISLDNLSTFTYNLQVGSGIESVEELETITDLTDMANAAIYTLDGVKVNGDTSSLTPGIYIVRTESQTYKFLKQ